MAKSEKKDTSKKNTTTSEEEKPWKFKKQYKVLLGCLFVLFSMIFFLLPNSVLPQSIIVL